MTGTAEPELPDTGGVAVVLAHAAWADGSSWNKVIAGLRSEGVKAVAVPLPLTTLADDVAALDQTLERVEGPVVVAGHAYAGAVIASTRDEKVASLVYVTALAPDEGETVGDVYYWAEHHPQAPALGPDRHGLAKSTGEPLLFKGNDFGHTDITPAMPGNPHASHKG